MGEELKMKRNLAFFLMLCLLLALAPLSSRYIAVISSTVHPHFIDER